MPYSAHSVWNHDIDSKGDGISDEGDMYLLPNGDSMEVGMMQNPATGTVQLYKEYWTEPPVLADGGGLRKLPCVVAQTIETLAEGSPNSKGRAMRIGDHFQGILKRPGQGILVERWTRLPSDSTQGQFTEGAKGDAVEVQWTKDRRSNTTDERQEHAVLPFKWLCDEDRQQGDEITVQGVKWAVTELER